MRDPAEMEKLIALAKIHELPSIMFKFIDVEDRSVAIIAGSHLEDLLATAIRSRLMKNENILKEYLKPESGTGNFSSKNKLANLLGVYTDRIRIELNKMASIRNDFAHNINVDSFNSNPQQGKVFSLTLPETNILIDPAPLPIRTSNWYNHTVTTFDDRQRILNNPRERFIHSFHLLTSILMTAILNPRHPTFDVDFDSPPPAPSPSQGAS